MSDRSTHETLKVLLVEDNPADVQFTKSALESPGKGSQVWVVGDGEEAMAFLHRKGRHQEAVRPDLILLDLNLPRKDGREVLEECKKDPDLRRIPIVIFSTSSADRDILMCYDLHANCYATKPFDIKEYKRVVQDIRDFWTQSVTLPPN